MQHDGASAHSARISLKMQEIFPQKWIGRAGIVHCPARSQNLTPLDYFLWDFTKSRVNCSNDKRRYEE